MTPHLGETVYLDFTTSDNTGAAADADSTPTAEVFEDANDTAILTPTVTKRASKTGNYRVPVACTAANGFEARKSYNVVVSATVGGVDAKACVGRFQLDPGADFTCAADATNNGTRVTLPSAYADGATLPNDASHAGKVLLVVGGTGEGQVVILDTRVGSTRQWNVSGQVTQLDNTSQCRVVGTARLHTPAAAAGRPSDLTGMLRRLFEHLANKRTRDRTTGAWTLYDTDGTTALESATQSTGGSTDQITQGA